MASGVRPFEEQDIPGCADLHRRVFNLSAEPGVDLNAAYASYFRTVFLENPWRAEGIGSLVCEENGKVSGFLAALPRPLRFRGRSILAMLTSQFVVDPANKDLAGVRLIKAFFAGRQEFTFADESNDISRRLWEGVGGRTAFAHSVHWTALLRPSQRLVEVMRPPSLLAAAANPVARLLDAGLSRIPRSPLRRAPLAAIEARTLEPLDLMRFWQETHAALIPDHTEASLSWTLQRIRQLKDLHGELRATTLWAKNQLIGAYAYHARPGQTSPVVLFAAQPNWGGPVLEHLFSAAAAAGVSTLTGRVPPRDIHAFSRANCLLSNRPKWTLVHSPSEPILHAVLSGDDALSALDGEWITHFNFRNTKG